MIKNNNLEVIWRLPTFIFLFLIIMTCTFIPCRAFSSEAVGPAINAGKEEIATFDEDEKTASDSEHTANLSTALHAEHYQPPVYFPERQKRFMTSQPWMRTLPFVVLVLLALATTRFFGRHRQKNNPAGNRPASEKIIVGIWIFMIITVIAGVAEAQISYSVKDAVGSLLGEGHKIYQKEIGLTKDVKQVLKEKLWWEPQESSIKVYYSKTPDGAVEAYAFVLSDILLKCGGVHKYCIKVSSKGQVEGVKILELNCPYSFAINNERFLNRLKLLNVTNADKMHIDAVTGATTSSKLSVMIIRRALLLFELLKGKVND
jgi:hypothetical protein